MGNLFRTADRSDRTYGPGGRLERANGTQYRYDVDGQLIGKRHADGAVWRYAWNGAGRLTAVQRPDGKIVAFVYDALGRRIRKEFDGRVIEYVWDGDDLVHERARNTDGTLEPLVTWVFEPEVFAPVAKIEGRNRYSVVTDNLGTPTMLLTEAGRVAWKAQLDLYGVPREEIRETCCPWRYPGQYEDPETGLYYNRFRYYDPEAGRYISQDPIGLLGGLAQYAYVHDPIGWLDPWGLSRLLPGECLVGPFEELIDSGSPGDHMTPHHVPSNGYMRGRGIQGYTRERGVAINMEHFHPGSGGRHRRTLSNGRPPDLSLTPRDVLAREVWDVRRIYRQDGLYGGYVRESLQQIIVENKRNHPRPFAKKGCK